MPIAIWVELSIGVGSTALAASTLAPIIGESPASLGAGVITLSVIGGLQLFEEPFILTQGRGGSDQAGMTTAVYLYRMAFDFNDFGAASAMSWLLFIVVAVLTALTHRVFEQRN